ncbi:hypothetical protein GCM10029992_52710 [Glycomyces albus]
MARSGDDVAFGLENQAVPAEEIWPRVREALAAVGFPTRSPTPRTRSPAASSSAWPWPGSWRADPT